MLATGSSWVWAYEALCSKGGTPKHTNRAAIIAREQGIDHHKRNISAEDEPLWVAAIDEELTSKAYIVPCIGDAGDLAYAKKL